MNTDQHGKFNGSIYLCGFMASGKSTLGQTLAEKMGWEFRDLDAVIEEGEGKSIKAIFADEGEAYFRELEREYLFDLTRTFKGVVSLGGGALHGQKVVDHLKLKGLLVFVDTPLHEIVERVHSGNERPILFDEDGEIKSKETLKEELKTLYSKRERLYKQAQITIKTAVFTSIEEMANEAIQTITRHV